MNTANLDDIKKIEFNVTKKLFKYIYTNINLNKLIEELDREYSYFYDTENNIAFNIWLSLDYIHKDGKTFSEKFLEEKSETLSPKEKKILEERKLSYVSLFKIIKYDGEYTYVEDLLTKKQFALLEPDLSKIINEGEYVFSRIGMSLDNYNFIGDINYLPSNNKYDFIKQVLRNFNLTRENHIGLTISNYLKRFGLNLYKIYDEIILNDIDNDSNSILYRIDDLENLSEFENYLSLMMNEDMVNIHITNLSDTIDSYFSNDYEELDNLLDIDLDDLLLRLVDDGFLMIKKELLLYIETLTLYFDFLSEKNSSYKDLYNEIFEISTSPFKYIKYLNSYHVNFNIDNNLSYKIRYSLNNKALDFIRDFDMFLLYIESSEIELTQKSKRIKREDLIVINESLKTKTKPTVKKPNQNHFINIDLFYYLALDLELLSINGSKMYFNKKAMEYFLLDEENKYIILFNNMLKEHFTNDKQNALLDTLSKIYKSEGISSKSTLIKSNKLFFTYERYLNLLGIVNYNKYKDDYITISTLGKKIINYLNNDTNSNKNIVINLMDFKK